MAIDKSGVDCGHGDGHGFCFGPAEPDYLAAIPAEQRRDILIDTDLCVIGNKHFFIRGCLDIPIMGTRCFFTWLVWVSLSQRSFNRAVDLWEVVGRESEPPYFGWLNTRIPGYPDTSSLKTNVHTLAVGKRPSILLKPTAHPIAIEQKEGITMARAEALSREVLLEWT